VAPTWWLLATLARPPAMVAPTTIRIPATIRSPIRR
jgi:hypothetical protein